MGDSAATRSRSSAQPWRAGRRGARRWSAHPTAGRPNRRLPGGQALLAARRRRPVRSRGRLREHEAVPLSSLRAERAGRGRHPPGRPGGLALRDSLAGLRSSAVTYWNRPGCGHTAMCRLSRYRSQAANRSRNMACDGSRSCRKDGRRRPVPVEKEPVPTVVFIGRLSANKRPEHAIRAFGLARRQLPDAQMWVIGSGPEEARLRKMAGPGVTFLGRVPEEEKRERLGRAHALVATSVREGWGSWSPRRPRAARSRSATTWRACGTRSGHRGGILTPPIPRRWRPGRAALDGCRRLRVPGQAGR